MSSFSFLFAEMLNCFHSRASSSDELEGRLQAAGERLGLKVLELVTYREKANRKNTLESFLSFISNNVWRMLFGRPADGLQRIPADNSYMILESAYHQQIHRGGPAQPGDVHYWHHRWNAPCGRV
ncbi:Transport protein particle (TRAPP) component [Carpediemonas membranifera]|uniref:Transport protein particle (TRAPP) component n=1 Tax=Carpediemonas membranifera TaxID=201153 RepID=A0A8J6DYZ7_9EUKA|nr:Transport protein particle (TRAPP) component [Carpediemonas membranifera]|eukprot:KAG9390038.1 Transport protein particle (TRAPP) component [Carpediemonas membranifera]